MQILLLGTGLQGKAALYDMVNSPNVKHIVAADANYDDLRAYVDGLDTDKVTPVNLDVRDEAQVKVHMRSAQAVISLLPQNYRLSAARLAIASGCHFIESSYTLPEYSHLGVEAAAKGLSILPEFGLDPGIDLVLAGQAVQDLDEVFELHAYGSGVPEPEAADNAIQYKVSWTFAGVLNSYQRPARILREGQAVDLAPEDIFSQENIHFVEVEGLGLMEAYPNGDALKYLDFLGIADTVSNSGRYSLRWRGHSAFWEKMVRLGFLSDAPIPIGNVEVSPRQFVHDLLLPQLQYGENERDIALVRIDARGVKNGEKKKIIYQVLDRCDLETGLLAMQRTVGFTTSIGAQMILGGAIRKPGLLSPTTDVPFDKFINELQKRGILVQRMEMPW